MKQETNPRLRAIRFYEAVQTEFPTADLATHIEALKADAFDYWRNAGVALGAIDQHSRNGRGYFSMSIHKVNRARFDQLRAEYAPNILFQA